MIKRDNSLGAVLNGSLIVAAAAEILVAAKS